MTQAALIYLSAPADSNLSRAQLDVKQAIIGSIEQEGLEPQEFFRSGISKSMAWSFEKAEMVIVPMPGCRGASWRSRDGLRLLSRRRKRPNVSIFLRNTATLRAHSRSRGAYPVRCHGRTGAGSWDDVVVGGAGDLLARTVRCRGGWRQRMVRTECDWWIISGSAPSCTCVAWVLRVAARFDAAGLPAVSWSARTRYPGSELCDGLLGRSNDLRAN